MLMCRRLPCGVTMWGIQDASEPIVNINAKHDIRFEARTLWPDVMYAIVTMAVDEQMRRDRQQQSAKRAKR